MDSALSRCRHADMRAVAWLVMFRGIVRAVICHIYDQVARLGVPYIMMHSRGTPGSMHSSDHKMYGDVEADVASELQHAADAAMAAGIRAWNIMLDPGIGFGKGAAENFRMLTAVSRIRKHLKGTLPSVCCQYFIQHIYSHICYTPAISGVLAARMPRMYQDSFCCRPTVRFSHCQTLKLPINMRQAFGRSNPMTVAQVLTLGERPKAGIYRSW